MKRGLLLLVFISICALSYGRNDKHRFTFGAEWSYSATFLAGHSFYFLAPEGYRIYDHDNSTCYMTDGEVFFHAGCNLNQCWNVSLYAGYTGIGDFHQGVPISVRITRFWGADPLKDRWFTFMDAGSGISIKKNPSELITAKIGGGYRLSLSKVSKLDFIASLRFIHTHPDVFYYGEQIILKDIKRNSAHIMSISAGIGLSF